MLASFSVKNIASCEAHGSTWCTFGWHLPRQSCFCCPQTFPTTTLLLHDILVIKLIILRLPPAHGGRRWRGRDAESNLCLAQPRSRGQRQMELILVPLAAAGVACTTTDWHLHQAFGFAGSDKLRITFSCLLGHQNIIHITKKIKLNSAARF